MHDLDEALRDFCYIGNYLIGGFVPKTYSRQQYSCVEYTFCGRRYIITAFHKPMSYVTMHARPNESLDISNARLSAKNPLYELL